MTKRSVPMLVLAVIVLTACSGTQWYEARCAERYALQRGTAEFNACVERERNIVESTQRRADRSFGAP